MSLFVTSPVFSEEINLGGGVDRLAATQIYDNCDTLVIRNPSAGSSDVRFALLTGLATLALADSFLIAPGVTITIDFNTAADRIGATTPVFENDNTASNVKLYVSQVCQTGD